MSEAEAAAVPEAAAAAAAAAVVAAVAAAAAVEAAAVFAPPLLPPLPFQLFVLAALASCSTPQAMLVAFLLTSDRPESKCEGKVRTNYCSAGRKIIGPLLTATSLRPVRRA